MEILNVPNGLYLIGLLWKGCKMSNKKSFFHDEIKNFNEEKVISLFSSYVEVHVFIITMKQRAESKDYFCRLENCILKISKTFMEGYMSEQIYYWSPIKHWEKLHNGKILIGETRFTGVLSEWFPEFYFFTQKGVKISELVEHFSLGNVEETQKTVELMIKNRVLVSNILHPREVFSTQEKIFPNPYSNQIRFSKEDLDRYE